MNILLDQVLEEHIAVVKKLSTIENDILTSGELMISALKNGNKILIAGNGGSAADAQHFAAELTGRFLKERQSLPAIAITTDSSALTAISNDYGYNNVFKRQVSGLANPGDVFIGISTSGNSDSINIAADYCIDNGVASIGLLGRTGGAAASIFNNNVVVPSDVTANIQECHILIIHIWCMMIDEAF